MATEVSINRSYCKSPFPSRAQLTGAERTTLAAAYIILTPFTLTLNGFLIYALIKTKQHSNVFARMILALSVSDFFVGCLVQPLIVYLFVSKDETFPNCVVSWFFTFVAYSLLNFSGMSIFLVSVDRYFRLRKTQRYTHSMNLRKTNIAVFMNATFSVVVAICSVVTSVYDMFCYFNLIVISINGLAASGILIFYLMAWRNVRKQISGMQSLIIKRKPRSESQSTILKIEPDDVSRQSEDLSRQSEESFNVRPHLMKPISLFAKLSRSKVSLGIKKTRSQYDAAMTRTVAAILICLCITYPPYFIVSFFRSLNLALSGNCEEKAMKHGMWFFGTFFLMFINSTANAFLYSCNNRAVKLLLRQLFYKNIKVNDKQSEAKKLNPDKAVGAALVSRPESLSVNL